jgi:hypothetical protein
MRWISVKEKKPPIDKYIFIATGYKPEYDYQCNIYVVCFYKEPEDYNFNNRVAEGNANGGCCSLYDISGILLYWAEIEYPEPPKDTE